MAPARGPRRRLRHQEERLRVARELCALGCDLAVYYRQDCWPARAEPNPLTAATWPRYARFLGRVA
jgi:hypothetical protein